MYHLKHRYHSSEIGNVGKNKQLTIIENLECIFISGTLSLTTPSISIANQTLTFQFSVQKKKKFLMKGVDAC